MGADKTRRIAVAPLALTLCLIVFIVCGGIYFSNYLRDRIYDERSTQLEEITAQVSVNLENALDSQWSFLAAAVNALEAMTWDGNGADGASVAFSVSLLENMLETEDNDSFLVLLDDAGTCYDADGEHGLWSDYGQVDTDAQRCAFISNSNQYSGGFWAFVEKLDEPIALGNGHRLTHAMLLKDMQTLVRFYDSSAYGNSAETYILKGDGTRQHDDVTQNNSIQSYNVVKTLEEMGSLESGSLIEALGMQGIVTFEFRMDGQDFFACITALEDYDTLLLFLIPSDLIAVGTLDMVRTVLLTLAALAVIFLMLVVALVISVTRRRNSDRMALQEQANARAQEELNRQLTEKNHQLADSKESVEQAFRIAEDANKAKSSFLSSMSHDIRTPMNAIVGFSTLLERDADDPDKVRGHAERITSSSRHLLGLINDVLDISKIEAGKTTLTYSDENILDVIAGIDAIIRPQMAEKGHTFTVDTVRIEHESIRIDKVRVNQILLNLLSNAMKYTPDGGHVEFTVEELQHSDRLTRYRFVVKDDGYGMSEDYLTKIFQTFTREEDSDTAKIQGTGLGMTITKNLVDLMGGTISVASRKGEGSTFTVELDFPLGAQTAENAASETVAEGDEDAGEILRGMHFLAAEDNAFNAELLSELLDMSGATCDICENGALTVEAFEKSRPGDYALILMDVQMPVMNGYEATKAIRSSAHPCASDIPIIAMTADAFAEDIARAHDAGMNAHIAKPIDMALFARTVKSVLDGVRKTEG